MAGALATRASVACALATDAMAVGALACGRCDAEADDDVCGITGLDEQSDHRGSLKLRDMGIM